MFDETKRDWWVTYTCKEWHKWGLAVDKVIYDGPVVSYVHCTKHDLVASYLSRHPEVAKDWRIERYFDVLAMAEAEARE